MYTVCVSCPSLASRAACLLLEPKNSACFRRSVLCVCARDTSSHESMAVTRSVRSAGGDGDASVCRPALHPAPGPRSVVPAGFSPSPPRADRRSHPKIQGGIRREGRQGAGAAARCALGRGAERAPEGRLHDLAGQVRPDRRPRRDRPQDARDGERPSRHVRVQYRLVAAPARRVGRGQGVLRAVARGVHVVQGRVGHLVR